MLTAVHIFNEALSVWPCVSIFKDGMGGMPTGGSHGCCEHFSFIRKAQVDYQEKVNFLYLSGGNLGSSVDELALYRGDKIVMQ